MNAASGSNRRSRPASWLGLVLRLAPVGGLLLLGVSAPASGAGGSPPERPITEVCSGVIFSGVVQLCGTLNPHGKATTGYYFAYNEGTSCTGGLRTEPGAPVEGEAVQVSSEVTGLEPSTEYTYCVVATNSAGEETSGQPVSQITRSMAPTIYTESVSGVGPTGAVLQAQINPHKSAASTSFELSLSPSLEEAETVPGEDIPAVLEARAVYASLVDLTPNTTYYYRAAAHNAGGGTLGYTESFTTTALAPQVTTGPVEGVGQSTATLTGQIDPLNASASYWFQYGTSEAYGSNAPITDAGAAMSLKPAATALGGLTPGTTYHFRLVASNAGGTAYGADQAFTTAPATPFLGQGPTTAPITGTETGSPEVAIGPRALTNAQKLARALRACGKKPKRQRASCRKRAAGRYGAKAQGKGRQSSRAGRKR
jgi:hypothetical protein